MIRPRIVPCLLVKDGALVKTVRFDSPKYVGDPLNAVRIFNEKEADELVVLDISATALRREPDYTLISTLAVECRMPLCYGGGVKTPEQFQRIVGLGVEKVAISTAAIETPDLISQASARVGRQSVVVVLDVRKPPSTRRYEVFTRNGTNASGRTPVSLARRAQSLGAGEIVVNSIDRDGVMTGYDHELISEIREAADVPVTALGGAGSLSDIELLIKTFGIIGAAAGSLFVFKGRYRAVLINYPNPAEKEAILERAGALRPHLTHRPN